MDLDLSDDCDFWDGVVPVTLTSTRTRGSVHATIPGCLGRQLSKMEKATSAGAYEGAGLTWLVPRKHVPESFGQLKGGDVIEAQEGVHRGRVFTAQSADLACLGAFYRLVSLDLSIVYDLRDEITIERPTTHYDAAGVEIQDFPPDGGEEVYRNLTAKVQLVSKEYADERMVAGFQGTHAVYLSKQIELTDADRIKWVKDQTTYYLDILGYRNPERLDELPVIDAVKKA